MGMHTTKVVVGEGKFALEAQLTVTPRGMAVYACSPEFAHLGATAQAIPRPEPGRTATVSILPFRAIETKFRRTILRRRWPRALACR